MRGRDIVIGFLVFAIIGLSLYGIYRVRTEEETPLITDAPTQLPEEERFESDFNFELPDNSEKASLEDKTGGDASGIVSRIFEDGEFSLTLLADLPDAEDGEYEIFIASPDGSEIKLGVAERLKGGHILEFTSADDLSEYNKLVVKKDGTVVAEASY